MSLSGALTAAGRFDGAAMRIYAIDGDKLKLMAGPP
jgi:hypothetical protein